MTGPTVLFIDTVHPRVRDTLQAAGFNCIACEQSSLEEIQQLMPTATGLVIRSRFPMNETTLSGAQQLQWIARSGIGLENIDLDFCRRNGIDVMDAAGANADAVGEHVIGMLLCLFRKLRSADNEVRQGIWDREKHRGIELGNRTLGIIGYGNTGRALAKKLSGFGTTVLAYDKYRPVDGPFAQAAELPEIQSSADVISFHLPLTTETRHYFDDAFLQAMQHPFYLVNASRGGVVSSLALMTGLKSGHILGACLDVLEQERPDLQLAQEADASLRYLFHSDNVLFSPHVAGWTEESHENLASLLLEKIMHRTQRNDPQPS